MVVVLLLMFVVDDDDGATYDNRVTHFKHAYQKAIFASAYSAYQTKTISNSGLNASYSPTPCYDQCRKRKLDLA